MTTSRPWAVILAEGAVQNRELPLPDSVLSMTTSVLLDWFAVAVAGGGTETPAGRLESVLAGAVGGARLMGSGAGTPSTTAALINGTAAHTLELDDIFAPGLYHPGAPTIAAALAVAQERAHNGAELLRSVVIGYEVGNRVAQFLGPGHYRHWHTTGTAGGIGAAAAVAELLRLPTQPFAHALALAATMGAGLQQTFRSDSTGKPMHSGHAAQTGVVAGLAAAAGLTGALDVLDADRGLAAATGASAPVAVTEQRFGPDFLIGQTTLKPYPCCGHTFAGIDAALALRDRGVRPEEVRSLHVETYAAALDVAGNPRPTTPFEAKFSIPFVIAAALIDGSVGLRSFEASRLRDPLVGRLLEQTSLSTDAGFDDAFPDRRGARLRIELHDGTRHESTIPDRRGDPANPLTRSDLERKFTELVEPVLGVRRAAELRGKVGAMATLTDLDGLPWGSPAR